MELSSIQHIDPVKLAEFQPDLFIVSLSHETRSTNIAKSLEGISCRKVAICEPGQVKEYNYLTNLGYLQDKGFEIIELDKDGRDIDAVFKESTREDLKIILDCTSMTQLLYYRIFNWFAENQEHNSVQLRLVYTMAAYVNEGSTPKVKKVKEFLKEKNNSLKRKRALILGLGQEANVSEMICRIVKPDLLYLFYADPPVEKHFVEKVFVNNHSVINQTPIRNLIAYPINHGQAIYQKLIDVILPLRKDYDISIIPQGPKIFSLVCILLQMGYPDTALSYPIFKRAQVQDRMPCGAPVVLDIFFEAED